MGIKTELLEKLEAVWDFIEGIFSDFFSELGNLIEKNGGELLLATADAAVKAAESHGGPGAEKFEIAYKTVVDKLTGEGVDVLQKGFVTAVEGAIIAAVAKMNSDKE